MTNSLLALYRNIVFEHSKLVLLFCALLIALLSPYASNFRLDASSDALVLENDQSLKYYREVVSKYNTADFLVLTYSPNEQMGDMFSDAVLTDLVQLKGNIEELDNIDSIISILDVPLTQSPPVTLSEMVGKQQYLLDEKTDRSLARLEFRDSQLYRDLLVSNDYSTTAIIISLSSDPEVSTLLKQRNHLRELRAEQGLNSAQTIELRETTLDYQAKAAAFQSKQNQLINDIRQTLTPHQQNATIFLGGLPMIVTDSIGFIQDDVVVFGAAALLIIILILAVAFRQIGWVVMPLITCFATGFMMVCILGLLNWPISVVSSNFLSLLLIITLSLNIHLIVRYRELNNLHPDSSQAALVSETIQSKFIPCLYTSLTTMVAFASLIVSGIRPVIDFGAIMCIGILVSLVTTFTLFPALALMMKPKQSRVSRDPASKLILGTAIKLYRQSRLATLTFVAVSMIAAYGLVNLTVENRFIDYFKPDTEIYKGMYQIDQKLGGTTPLDIIIDAPRSFIDEQITRTEQRNNLAQQLASTSNTAADPDFDDFDDFDDSNDLGSEESDLDDFDDFDDFSEPSTVVETGKLVLSGYWFNPEGLRRIKLIHDSLEALGATGKVMSLSTSMSIFDNLKDAEPMDSIDLGFMYNVLSQDNKNTLFVPYLSDDGNQIHISIRVFESRKGLDRNKLIANIRQLLIDEHGINDQQINISGYLVLYNNMLNSLFSSQIKTLGTVFLVILLMFIVLFKNIKLAAITLIPNVFSAAVVLGIMGIFRIPLDLMTITIAAISVGIAVDNSIHFVARFKDENLRSENDNQAIDTATNNIGQAMFYTTLVITAGFLIMVFSNFVPTMYFGILTAIAMVTALIANLVMLPMLLARYRPLSAD